ncbi:hypothetical protein GCM10007422_41180 [Pedobacter zeae]|uniref:Uncharacterized protein n=1 Tax=Pedobacter zeae TaxID=1737356 RepID=A0ABQ1Y9B1_9SPHI|nr:hypothetical protein GCM10007422_41180 [Pedobacter zeae]
MLVFLIVNNVFYRLNNNINYFLFHFPTNYLSNNGVLSFFRQFYVDFIYINGIISINY